jgi:hypothetical protein
MGAMQSHERNVRKRLARAALGFLLAQLAAAAAAAAPPILVTNEPLLIDPGETSSITSAQLAVEDPDTSPWQIVYTLESIPSHGTLWGAAPMGIGDIFLQQHLNFGQVWYTHDGGPAAADSFVFTVSDGSGGAIGPTVFEILIAHPPTVPALGGLAKLTLVGVMTLAALAVMATWAQGGRGREAKGSARRTP